MVERYKLPFRILADEDAEMIRAYGVLHEGGMPGGGDIALPAHFLIDRDGRIAWKFIAGHPRQRPHEDTLRAEIEKL